MKNLDKKMAVATKWSSFAEIAAKLILPVVNMILARILTPEAFGVVVTINIVITFAEIFQDAGFQKFIIQHNFEDEETLNHSSNVAFWMNFCISLLLFLLIAIFENPIASLVGGEGLGKEIAVASLSIPIFSFSSMQMARCKRDLDFKKLFRIRIITSLIPLLVTVPLAFWLRNHWALIIGTIVRNVVQAIMLYVGAKWKPKFEFDSKLLKQMLPFVVWTLLESITIWLSGNISTFIVTKKLGIEQVGFYRTSISTSTSILGIIQAATTAVLFSSLSRVQDDDAEFNRIFYDFQKLVSMLVIPMGVGMFIFRDLLTLILLGEQWMNCSFFIGLYSLFLALTIVTSYFFSELYRAKGKPRISMIAQIGYMAVTIPVILVASEKGFDTLCGASCLSLFSFILIHCLLIKIYFKEVKISVMLKNIALVLLPTAVMAAAGILMKSFADGIVWSIIEIILCIAIYFAMVLLMKPLRNTIKNSPITGPAYQKCCRLLTKKDDNGKGE